MKTAIIFQTFFPQKINGFLIVGALDIAQLVPLSCSRSKINNLYNYSIIKNEEDINSYQIANIITDYLKRNGKKIPYCLKIYLFFQSLQS